MSDLNSGSRSRAARQVTGTLRRRFQGHANCP